ncbi:MAG: hypothetical protein HONDAALG_01133 [Gammaproteobacteria bacterium]|nr:hypothetical protein [Gammaproteobacteria bacterium]
MRVIAAAALAGALTLAHAAGSVRVAEAWIEEGPPDVPVLAGYATIHNPTAQTARVLNVSSPRAERIEIHRSEITENTVTMTRVDELPIPPGGEIRFTPAGYHLMIYGVAQPPAAGEKLPVEFEFDGARKVTVEAIVRRSEGSAGAVEGSGQVEDAP